MKSLIMLLLILVMPFAWAKSSEAVSADAWTAETSSLVGGIELELRAQYFANLTRFYDFHALQKDKGRSLPKSVLDRYLDHFENFYSLPPKIQEQLSGGLKLDRPVLLKADAPPLPDDVKVPQVKLLRATDALTDIAKGRPPTDAKKIQTPTLNLKPGPLDEMHQAHNGLILSNMQARQRVVENWKAMDWTLRNTMVDWERLDPVDKAHLVIDGQLARSLRIKAELPEETKELLSRFKAIPEKASNLKVVEWIHAKPVPIAQMREDMRKLSQLANVNMAVEDPLEYPHMEWGSLHYHLSRGGQAIDHIDDRLRALNHETVAQRLALGIDSDLREPDETLVRLKPIDQKGLVAKHVWPEQPSNPESAEFRGHFDKADRLLAERAVALETADTPTALKIVRERIANTLTPEAIDLFVKKVDVRYFFNEEHAQDMLIKEIGRRLTDAQRATLSARLEEIPLITAKQAHTIQELNLNPSAKKYAEIVNASPISAKRLMDQQPTNRAAYKKIVSTQFAGRPALRALMSVDPVKATPAQRLAAIKEAKRLDPDTKVASIAYENMQYGHPGLRERLAVTRLFSGRGPSLTTNSRYIKAVYADASTSEDFREIAKNIRAPSEVQYLNIKILDNIHPAVQGESSKMLEEAANDVLRDGDGYSSGFAGKFLENYRRRDLPAEEIARSYRATVAAVAESPSSSFVRIDELGKEATELEERLGHRDFYPTDEKTLEQLAAKDKVLGLGVSSLSNRFKTHRDELAIGVAQKLTAEGLCH